jgi:uncharacterized protein Usg
MEEQGKERRMTKGPDGGPVASRDFLMQVQGYGLTTAEISYWMPDHPSLIQLFVWQTYDVAPAFPVLHDFLDHWRREIEATLHSIRVAHQHLIRPAEWRAVDGVITIN